MNTRVFTSLLLMVQSLHQVKECDNDDNESNISYCCCFRSKSTIEGSDWNLHSHTFKHRIYFITKSKMILNSFSHDFENSWLTIICKSSWMRLLCTFIRLRISYYVYILCTSFQTFWFLKLWAVVRWWACLLYLRKLLRNFRILLIKNRMSKYEQNWNIYSIICSHIKNKYIHGK